MLQRFVPQFITRRFGKEEGGLVNVVRLNGAIGNAGRFQQSLSLESVAGLLEKAFAPKGVKAVALLINSPGGSPVQSSLIGKRIRALAEEKDVPVVAFVEDVAASGGYWLACAADEIFVDESSIVGSIGVIAAGFGLSDLLKRQGVDRRVYTAGKNKLRLDPFQPEKREDIAWVKGLQADIHETFRAWVKSRRGGKLVGDEETLMNGDIWVGQAAVDNGLVDGLGDLRSIMRGRFGEKVKLRVIQKPGGLGRRLGLRSSFDGGLLTQQAVGAVEERLLWSRFGL